MLLRWNTESWPFGRLRGELNRLLDESMLAARGLPGWVRGQAAFPRLNVTETAEALNVTCELPGVARDDIDISVEGDVLTIRGERKRPEEGREDARYVRRERRFGPFERSFELPAKVDVENVTARLTGGVLDIVLPKHPETKPRRIELK